MSDTQGPPLADPRGQIAGEILDVHRSSYGTGAGRVTVHLLDDTVLVVLDDLEFSVAEKTLLDGGHDEAVSRMRDAYQAAIGSTFRALVERATGREVTSFHSLTSISDRFSVEIFRVAA